MSYVFVFIEVKEIRNLKNVKVFLSKPNFFTQNALNHDKSDIDW